MCVTREADGMAEKSEAQLDRAQVKKAVQALQAFLKTKATGSSLLLDETQQISLLLTLWKIPRKKQAFRIPLPHGHRSETKEVCLFTKDEPRMTPEQTQRFYKRLLQEKGVQNVSEVIPYSMLKTEYKPYEAKRLLLANFDMFLSDERVRRLLPSHLGKHFYESKRVPLPVNLQSKHLARDVERIIQGTTLTVTNKGCCCMARVAHSGMTADEVADNIEAAVQTVVAKLQNLSKGPVLKVVHLKSETSVALPIYTSDWSHLGVLDTPRQKKAAKKKQRETNKTEDKKRVDKTPKRKITLKQEEEEEEEIPQLVLIETPDKKPKLEKPSKKQKVQTTPKPVAAKKGVKTPNRLTKKVGAMVTKGKRKVK